MNPSHPPLNFHLLKEIEPQLQELEKEFYQKVQNLGVPLDLSFLDIALNRLNISVFSFWQEGKRKQAAVEADEFYETQVSGLKHKIYHEMEKVIAETEAKINQMVDRAKQELPLETFHPSTIRLSLKVPPLLVPSGLYSWSTMVAIQTFIKMPIWMGPIAGPIAVGPAYEEAKEYHLWDKKEKYRKELEQSVYFAKRKLRDEWAKTVSGFKESLKEQILSAFDDVTVQEERGNNKTAPPAETDATPTEPVRVIEPEKVENPQPAFLETPPGPLMKPNVPVMGESLEDILKKIVLPIEEAEAVSPPPVMAVPKVEMPPPTEAPVSLVTEDQGPMVAGQRLADILKKMTPPVETDFESVPSPLMPLKTETPQPTFTPVKVETPEVMPPQKIQIPRPATMKLPVLPIKTEVENEKHEYSQAEFRVEIDRFLRERKEAIEVVLAELENRLAESLLDAKTYLTAQKIKDEFESFKKFPALLSNLLAQNHVLKDEDFQALYFAQGEKTRAEFRRRYAENCQRWEGQALYTIKSLVNQEFAEVEEKFRQQLNQLKTPRENAYQKNHYDQLEKLRGQLENQYRLGDDVRRKIAQIYFPSGMPPTLDTILPLDRLKEPWVSRNQESLEEFAWQWDGAVRKIIEEAAALEMADGLKKFDAAYSEMNLRIWDGLLDDMTFVLLRTAGENLQVILEPPRDGQVMADNYYFSDGSPAREEYFSQYGLSVKNKPEINQKIKLYNSSCRLWEGKVSQMVQALMNQDYESVFEKFRSRLQELKDWAAGEQYQRAHYEQMREMTENPGQLFVISEECKKKISQIDLPLKGKAPSVNYESLTGVKEEWVEKCNVLVKSFQAEWDAGVIQKIEQIEWNEKASVLNDFQQAYEEAEKAVAGGILNEKSLLLLETCERKLKRLAEPAPSGGKSAGLYYFASGQTAESRDLLSSLKNSGGPELELLKEKYAQLRDRWEARGIEKIKAILEEQYEAVYGRIRNRIEELKSWNREECFKAAHYTQLNEFRKSILREFILPEGCERLAAGVLFPPGSSVNKNLSRFDGLKIRWVDLSLSDMKAYEEQWDTEVDQFVEYYCNGVVNHIGIAFQDSLDEVSLRVSDYLLDEKSFSILQQCREELKALETPSPELTETVNRFYFTNGLTVLNHYLSKYRLWLEHLKEGVSRLENTWDRKLRNKLNVLIDTEISRQKEERESSQKVLAERIDKNQLDEKLLTEWHNWKSLPALESVPSNQLLDSCSGLMGCHGEKAAVIAREILSEKIDLPENRTWLEEMRRQSGEMEGNWRQKINSVVQRFVLQSAVTSQSGPQMALDQMEKRVLEGLFDQDTVQLTMEFENQLGLFLKAPQTLLAAAPSFVYPDGQSAREAVEKEYGQAVVKEKDFFESRRKKLFQLWDGRLKQKLSDSVKNQIQNSLAEINSSIETLSNSLVEKGSSLSTYLEIETLQKRALSLESLGEEFVEQHKNNFLPDQSDPLIWAAEIHRQIFSSDSGRVAGMLARLNDQWDKRLFKHHSDLMEQYLYGEVINPKAPVPYILKNQIEPLKKYFKTRIETEDKSKLATNSIFTEQMLAPMVDHALKPLDALLNLGELKVSHYFSHVLYPEELRKNYTHWKAKYVQAIRWEVERVDSKKIINVVHFNRIMIHQWMDALITAVKNINEFFELEYFEKTETVDRG